MNKRKAIFLTGLLAAGIFLIVYLHQQQTSLPYQGSLAPAFQLSGKSTAFINKALGRVMPVNELDEAEFGEVINVRYRLHADTNSADYQYLNALLKSLLPYTSKPFPYHVYLNESNYPNAFAMPGGTLVVTRGLLDTLQNEAQLVAILGHELGHVERGHCFDAVKFQLLGRKTNMMQLGQLADFCSSIMFRHSYSKTQESQADEFGYALLLETEYTPDAMEQAFHVLLDSPEALAKAKIRKTDILFDYYTSHPPTPLRIHKYEQEAEEWWSRHSNEQRYLGVRNFAEGRPFTEIAYLDEWISASP